MTVALAELDNAALVVLASRSVGILLGRLSPPITPDESSWLTAPIEEAFRRLYSKEAKV